MAITLTENAAKQIQQQLAKRGKGIALRIGIKKVGCTGLAHTFDIADEITATDHSFESHDARVLIDADNLAFLDGSRIDFVKGESVGKARATAALNKYTQFQFRVAFFGNQFGDFGRRAVGQD